VEKKSKIPVRLKGMQTKLTKYDVADHLESDEEIEFFLEDARETGDECYIAKARDIAARAKESLRIQEGSSDAS
jgi:DNA-binding phage protein